MGPTVQLRPHARVLRRGAGAVQVGLVPEAGIVLTGLSDPELKVLDLLRSGCEVSVLARAAATRGCPPERVTALLATLRRHALLAEPAPASSDVEATSGLPLPSGSVASARRTRTVVLDGSGRLADTLRHTLRAAGVGRIDCGPHAGADWEHALAGGRHDRPDLVVLIGTGAMDATRGEPWRRHRMAHLPVLATGPRVCVGPMVQQGAACLHCLDLHRADRDGHWPHVLSQLVPIGPNAAEPAQVDVGVATLVAGWATMLIQLVLDGGRAPQGLSVEVTAGRLAAVRRRWSRHPRCPGCQQPPQW